MKQYWMYIVASRGRRLYTGMTNDLEHRVREHKAGKGSAFTKRYKIRQLVYFEMFSSPTDAIRREKEIKGWTREKKLRLVEATNAGWIDLAAHVDGEINPA
ncbi:MAG: hypothetical protein Rubg2KO_23420 [Rubricoccaceae bacterium]